MRFLVDHIFIAMWLGYSLYWWLSARKVKGTTRREAWTSRMARLACIVAAFMLLWVPRFHVAGLDHRFVPLGAHGYWIGAAITACGLLFSIWARRHLGTNWSQAVTLKTDHELITSGPYGWVRHPIYTGLLVGFLGTAIARGELRGLVAVLLVLTVLWLKLRLEETWLSAQFGEAYTLYSRRVAALVPFLL